MLYAELQHSGRGLVANTAVYPISCAVHVYSQFHSVDYYARISA